MLLFGFECDVKNVSLSQIFLTEPMLVVVTVVFGQIVRVIRLVLRVSWCESQNASLQALFVCTLMVGMWYQFMQRYCAAGENFGLSAGNHVLLNGSQITKFLYMIYLISLGKASGNHTPYRSQNPHLHHQPAQFNRWDVLT